MGVSNLKQESDDRLCEGGCLYNGAAVELWNCEDIQDPPGANISGIVHNNIRCGPGKSRQNTWLSYSWPSPYNPAEAPTGLACDTGLCDEREACVAYCCMLSRKETVGTQPPLD